MKRTLVALALAALAGIASADYVADLQNVADMAKTNMNALVDAELAKPPALRLPQAVMAARLRAIKDGAAAQADAIVAAEEARRAAPQAPAGPVQSPYSVCYGITDAGNRSACERWVQRESTAQAWGRWAGGGR